MLDKDWFSTVSQKEYKKKSKENALRFVTCEPMCILNTEERGKLIELKNKTIHYKQASLR